MSVLLNTTTTHKITQKSHEIENEVRVNMLQLGDGYDHTSIDGVNYELEAWHLEFLPKSASEAAALVAILKTSRIGMDNVLEWTVPGESTAKYWKATDVLRRYVGGDKWTVTCTMTRCYPI